jgi:hypothetical protein
MMQDNLHATVKEIAKCANAYAKSKESKHMDEIEHAIQTLFESQTVKFWKVDTQKETIQLLNKDTDEALFLESSLTKQAIESKKALLENHVSSDKYYNVTIDNPFALKIKALMIYPILKGKTVIGVLKVWRGIKQRKVFSKKDEEILLALSSLWLHILESREIDKETVLSLLGENVEKDVIKPRVHKEEQTKKTVAKNVKYSRTELIELESLKQERDTLKEENKRFVENEKEQEKLLQSYKDKIVEIEKEYKKSKNETSSKENELVFQTKIDAYDKELEASKIKYKELESSSLELYSESQLNQIMIKTLEKELKLLKKENKNLLLELKEKEHSCKSIKDLKSEKSLLAQQNKKNVMENIEDILMQVDNRFAENEYAYMLFEMMLYALNSKKGIAYIEESIKKSKIVPTIIDGYYFKSDLQVHNEKYLIADLVKHIQSYEKHIFSNMINIKVHVDDVMPASLVIDAPKIQSTLLHLLIDLHQFVDHSKAVHVNFTFKKKFLHIEIGGSIHKKNSLFQSMFKQTKLGGDEKDRIGLQLSKKVIARLKGEIDYLYEDNYYKFIMTVPTQVIKM